MPSNTLKVMPARPQNTPTPAMIAQWAIPGPALLGSSVRAKGIEREIQARLPRSLKKCIAVESGHIVLGVPEAEKTEFDAASKMISGMLEGLHALPILPSEAEDILNISARERLKWTRDARLSSAGTRTIKLRGRARTVTFHVFDPRHIEDVLDRDLPTVWREEDAQAVTENRKRGAGKAALTRAGKGGKKSPTRGSGREGVKTPLQGWDAFEADGLLR